MVTWILIRFWHIRFQLHAFFFQSYTFSAKTCGIELFHNDLSTIHQFLKHSTSSTAYDNNHYNNNNNNKAIFIVCWDGFYKFIFLCFIFYNYHNLLLKRCPLVTDDLASRRPLFRILTLFIDTFCLWGISTRCRWPGICVGYNL